MASALTKQSLPCSLRFLIFGIAALQRSILPRLYHKMKRPARVHRETKDATIEVGLLVPSE